MMTKTTTVAAGVVPTRRLTFNRGRGKQIHIIGYLSILYVLSYTYIYLDIYYIEYIFIYVYIIRSNIYIYTYVNPHEYTYLRICIFNYKCVDFHANGGGTYKGGWNAEGLFSTKPFRKSSSLLRLRLFDTRRTWRRLFTTLIILFYTEVKTPMETSAVKHYVYVPNVKNKVRRTLEQIYVFR